MSSEHEWQLVRLQARIAALEAALHRRSEELRRILHRLPPEAFEVVEQVMAEMPVGRAIAFSPAEWRETFNLVPADVESMLAELWRETEEHKP